MVRTAKTGKSTATKVCTTNPRFTTNKAGRIVSAAASKAAKENYRDNRAIKRWKRSVRQASKETGIKLTPSNLKKGTPLYEAARKRYDG